MSHGFPKDEFPSLMEQEKLSSKEKEELGKHHHQQEGEQLENLDISDYTCTCT